MTENFWQGPELAAWPALSGNVRAQVVVVGAGYTGLSAALHAAEAGFDVLVLDRHGPGWGASGQNGGLVVPDLPVGQERLLQMFGTKQGSAFAQTAAAGADLVFDLIDRYAIACEAQTSGSLCVARSARGLRVLSHANRLAAEPGQVELLDKAGVAALVGSPAFVGGVLDRRGGAVNPLKYTLGLAHGAQARGVRIYGGSAATRLSRAHFGWVVETAEGMVSTRSVILATGVHSDELWPGLRRGFLRVPVLQIATEPLPEALRAEILPQGQVLFELHDAGVHVRLDGQGRLLLGMRGAFGKTGVARAVRTARQIFPQLADVAFPQAWGGFLAQMPDFLPHVHELAPALLTGLGYQWRGVALGTMMGRVLARWATGTPREALGFPVTKFKAMEFPELAAFGAAVRLRLGG